jgi:hypothetical protein
MTVSVRVDLAETARAVNDKATIAKERDNTLKVFITEIFIGFTYLTMQRYIYWIVLCNT